MSDNRGRYYCASQTNLVPEQRRGVKEEEEEEVVETEGENRLLRFQLSLELQLQSVCQDLLETYKQSRDWPAVSQLAQSLITNSQRVSQINEQLTLSAESESSSLPPPNQPLLESIQEADSEEEHLHVDSCGKEIPPDIPPIEEGEPAAPSEEDPVKLPAQVVPQSPTPPDKENISKELEEEVKRKEEVVEVVGESRPREESKSVEVIPGSQRREDQPREEQQREVCNNSFQPVSSVDTTEQYPLSLPPVEDFEAESASEEDDFRTPEETTPERSTEASDFLTPLSETAVNREDPGYCDEIDLGIELVTAVETSIEPLHLTEDSKSNLPAIVIPETQETSESSRDKTPEPLNKEDSPDRESSEDLPESVEEAEEDVEPGSIQEIDHCRDLTSQQINSSSIISKEGALPQSLGEDKPKPDGLEGASITTEPLDQLDRSGSGCSLSGDLLEVDQLLFEINQEEFTVDSVQPVPAPPTEPAPPLPPPQATTPEDAPVVVGVANEDPQNSTLVDSGEEDSDQNTTLTEDNIAKVENFSPDSEETPDFSITNKESKEVTSSQEADSREEGEEGAESSIIKAELSTPQVSVQDTQETPDINTTNKEFRSLCEMDPATYSVKYTVTKAVQPPESGGQIYYQISHSESPTDTPVIIHTLDEFHSLTDALKLDPFALDISYPDCEAQNDSTVCSNCEKLGEFLNRCVCDPALSSDAKLHEFLSASSSLTVSANLESIGEQPSKDETDTQAKGEEGSSVGEERSDASAPNGASELSKGTNSGGGVQHEEGASTLVCTTPDVEETIINSATENGNHDAALTLPTVDESRSPFGEDDPLADTSTTPTPTQQPLTEGQEEGEEEEKEEGEKGDDISTVDPALAVSSHLSPSPSTASSSTNITTDESSVDDLITRSESNPILGGFDTSESVATTDMFMSLQPMSMSSGAEKSASTENILKPAKSSGKVKRQGSVPSILSHGVRAGGRKIAKSIKKKSRTNSTLQASSVSPLKVTPTMEWDPTCLLEELYSDRRQGVTTAATASGEVARHFGYLEKLPVNSKKSTVVKGYKRRYFRAMEGKLYYYEDRKSEKALGFAKLTNSRLVLIPEKLQIQVVEKSGKFVVIKASNDVELNAWYRDLQLEATHATIPAPLSPTAPSSSNPPVLIIDVGACSVRAGISSEEPYPALFFPAVCSLDATTLEPLDCGNNALLPRNRCNAHLVYPRKVSLRMDKNDSYNRLRAYQSIVDTIISLLNIQPQSTQLIFTLPPTVPAAERDDLAVLLLETFGFFAVCFQEQALLALYSYNTTTGIIVDIGDHIDVVPIIDGYTIEAGITRLPFGGNAITESLSKLITSKGFRYFSETEQYINRFIKESLCYVSQDIKEDSANCESNPTDYLRGVDVDRFNPPDLKKMIHLDSALFRAPEGLFDPAAWGKDVQGIQEYVWKAIQACPIDHRKDLAKNIYLSGATTLLPGLKERLQKEVSALASPAITVTVSDGSSRQHAAFQGASVLAGLGTFQNLLVSQEEWGSAGVDALHKWNVSAPA